jgi:hypothetical protein
MNRAVLAALLCGCAGAAPAPPAAVSAGTVPDAAPGAAGAAVRAAPSPPEVVLDRVGEDRLIAGRCGTPAPVAEATALCVVRADARATEVPLPAPLACRADLGAVLLDDGRLVATDGIAVAVVAPDGAVAIAELAGELARYAGLDPRPRPSCSGCPEWRVVAPLRREGARFVMRFAAFGGDPVARRSAEVAVEMLFGANGSGPGGMFWQRIDEDVDGAP